MTTEIETITVTEASSLISEDKAVLIDVREPDEYEYEHIEAAVNIPLSEIDRVLEKEQEERMVVLQCQSGNRSGKAFRKLRSKATDLNIKSLDGGINAWKQANQKVVKGSRASLPIMRQVQIAAGSMIVVGVLLAVLVSQMFWVIPGFIGAGLVFAGVTGFCGLARLLEIMPWNKVT